MQKINAVLGVPIDDFVSADVRKIILQNFFTQQINQGLNVLCHFFLGLGLFKRGKVDVGEGTFEKLDVKLVAEKDCHVVDLIFDAQVTEYLVSELQNSLYN